MIERDVVYKNLNEFNRDGGLKVFNPAGYLLQMVEAFENGKAMNFDGLEDDLEAVVAETILEAELRQKAFEISFDDQGNLYWPALGHEGRDNGTVLDMASYTVNRYKKMAEDEELSESERMRAAAMAERFDWERKQLEKIINMLEKGGEGQMVLGILPDNEVVYPVSSINYLTIYKLEKSESRIVSYPLMNRYSLRLLSELAGGENLSEQELILAVVDVGKNIDPKQVFLKAESLVNDEERQKGLVGSINDRTKEVEDCQKMIKAGRQFLEKIIRFEFNNLVGGDEWVDIRSRLDTAWELVIKNIVGFVEEEKYLSREGLMEKVGWYVSLAERGFGRQRFLHEIVIQDDLQILTQSMVRAGACGGLDLPGLDNVLGSDPITNLMNVGEKRQCCQGCGTTEGVVCGWCKSCAKIRFG
jgi:hypothetical protein